jgi:cbb3-type cytochrome oxidase maturation protein
MESLYFLVPCALIFIAIAVKVLFWAINNGQYDNLDTEAHRILFDEEKKKKLDEQNNDPLANATSAPNSQQTTQQRTQQTTHQNTQEKAQPNAPHNEHDK